MLALVMVAMTGGIAAQQQERGKGRQAQEQKADPDTRVKKETERMATELGLDASQKTLWENAARERILANEPLRQKMRGSTTPEERRDLRRQMHTNQKTFYGKVSAGLTDEQRKRFEALREQKKGHAKGRHHKDREARQQR